MDRIVVGARDATRIHGPLQVEHGRHRVLGQPLDLHLAPTNIFSPISIGSSIGSRWWDSRSSGSRPAIQGDRGAADPVRGEERRMMAAADSRVRDMTPRRYGPLPYVPITRRPKPSWPGGALDQPEYRILRARRRDAEQPQHSPPKNSSSHNYRSLTPSPSTSLPPSPPPSLPSLPPLLLSSLPADQRCPRLFRDEGVGSRIRGICGANSTRATARARLSPASWRSVHPFVTGQQHRTGASTRPSNTSARTPVSGAPRAGRSCSTSWLGSRRPVGDRRPGVTPGTGRCSPVPRENPAPAGGAGSSPSHRAPRRRSCRSGCRSATVRHGGRRPGQCRAPQGH